MKVLELLSPAKDLETGIAAINYGADAVYIGAPKYGARAAVGNSISDIEKLVQYAHKYWAKVYVTVNTLLYDNELEDVRKLIFSLHESGTDAIIIQDMSILEMDLPPVPVFASTQTHNYSVEKIKFLEKAGFKRVILARELSINQIKEISQQTNVELEFFVHGALCVSFSGQCYFSHATTKRSANRGECSQPCRLPYSLVDKYGNEIIKDKYLLSLKDLKLSNHLNNLINAGITSFKIEGRLKDINYVKNITSFYRQKIDEIIKNRKDLQKASSGEIDLRFSPDPNKTFNRGYTEYFINGENWNLSSFNTPKFLGQYIGKVKSVNKSYFEMDSKEQLNNADGICFFNKNEILAGMNIRKVDGRKIFVKEMEEVFTGAKIFRNHDHNFLKMLSNDKSSRKIPIRISLADDESGIKIKAEDIDRNKIIFIEKTAKTPAENPSMMLGAINTQLSKSGDSIFFVTEIEIELQKVFYLPLSEINTLRRKIFHSLENERIKNFPKQEYMLQKTNHSYPEQTLYYNGNVLNKEARKFYENHGVQSIENGFELQQNLKNKVLMKTRYCIKKQLGICPMESPKNSKYEEPLYLKDHKRKYLLSFNCKECMMEIKTL